MKRLFLKLVDNEYVMLLILVTVLALAILNDCSPSLELRKAKARPTEILPVDQWDPVTQIWLARAMVGEAGWKAVTDHVAISYVLVRRWKTMSKRWPDLRFRDVLLRYAKALGDGRREFTPRQLWIRALDPSGTEPAGWPSRASWDRHRPLWIAAVKRANDWRRGRFSDPCRGRAWHWGGTIDVPKKRMIPVDCGETANTFYRVESD